MVFFWSCCVICWKLILEELRCLLRVSRYRVDFKVVYIFFLCNFFEFNVLEVLLIVFFMFFDIGVEVLIENEVLWYKLCYL